MISLCIFCLAFLSQKVLRAGIVIPSFSSSVGSSLEFHEKNHTQYVTSPPRHAGAIRIASRVRGELFYDPSFVCCAPADPRSNEQINDDGVIYYKMFRFFFPPLNLYAPLEWLVAA